MGIFVDPGSSPTIAENEITGCGTGIYDFSNSTITRNKISNNSIGIGVAAINAPRGAIITHNVITDNIWDFSFEGTTPPNISFNTVGALSGTYNGKFNVDASGNEIVH